MLAARVSCSRCAFDISAPSRGVWSASLDSLGLINTRKNALLQNWTGTTSVFWEQRRTKLNFQHPPSPHARKRRILHVTKPFYFPLKRPVNESCVNLMPRDEPFPLNPLEFLLAMRAREVIADAKLLVLAHTNPTSINTWKTYQNKVFKTGIRLWRIFDNRVLMEATKGTRFEVMKPFMQNDYLETILITSPELNFQAMVKALKFFSSYVPLLAIVEGSRVVSYPQLQAFAKTYKAGITGLHAEVSASLSSPLSVLSQNIQHPYWMLSRSLDYISKNPS
ncbi:uncharacterized protein LOC129588204 [Paramacrobiotus metropolitanus]|uniref:uncharacterized protein LOC129588204 n=1 Tax=Paramacrobiotus metropolitanus TaxID=2943436 RepID=UPI00244644D7|nr:uncharacterized protein LOC129588204 [Paramacrobiotus metropolitanus]